MHELGVAMDIVDAVTARSAGARVTRVVVEVGKLSAVLPEALRFCFGAACEGTPLDGAALDILETPGRARCRACDSMVELERAFGTCRCGNSDLEWLSGDELRIREFEVS